MPNKPRVHQPYPGGEQARRQSEREQRAAYNRTPARRQAKKLYDSKAWQDTRAAHLLMEPCCKECQRQGRVTPAVEVHHVKPLNERPDLAFDHSNLEGLCKSCHSRLTATEGGGFGNGRPN